MVGGGTSQLRYQWLQDNAAINHQTTASLLLNSPKSQDSGNYTVVVSNMVGAVTSAPAVINVISSPFGRMNTASNWMISAFPATRGYQYTADCSVGGLNGWYAWTNTFADYAGVVWLTNSMANDSLFLRVHSP